MIKRLLLTLFLLLLSSQLFAGDTIDPNSSITDPDGDAITYLWTFQNGTPATSTAANPPEVTFTCGAYPCSHSCSLVATDEHGCASTFSFTVTHLETAPTANNFTGDSGLIGWWELGDNTDSSGNGNILDVSDGDPQFVGGALVLDGDDSRERADLSVEITGDVTSYAKFKFDGEIADNTWANICGEYDYGDDERVDMLSAYDDSGGGAEDELVFYIGHSAGADNAELLLTTYDMVHTVEYRGIGTYTAKPTDDAFLYLYSAAGSLLGSATNAAFLGAETQHTDETPFIVGAGLNSDAPASFLTGSILELARWNRALSADEVAAVGSDQYPRAIIAENIGISADATYGEGQDIIVATVFKQKTTGSTYVPVNVTYIDGGTDSTLTAVLDAGANLVLTHSYPASGVAGAVHYWEGTVSAGQGETDLDISTFDIEDGTFTYGSPAINCDVTLPSAPDNLATNAAIVIDTSASNFDDSNDNLRLTNSSGVIINGATYTSGSLYITLEGEENLQFKDGPSGEFKPTIALDYGTVVGTLVRGWDSTTDEGTFEFALEGEDRCNSCTMGETALPSDGAILVDTSPAENEVADYNYPDGANIVTKDAAAINIAVPKPSTDPWEFPGDEDTHGDWVTAGGFEVPDDWFEISAGNVTVQADGTSGHPVTFVITNPMSTFDLADKDYITIRGSNRIGTISNNGGTGCVLIVVPFEGSPGMTPGMGM